jgi:predicted  nucleic acid-binding Zn-ribbon protein
VPTASPDQLRLLRLQELDSTLDRLALTERNHPTHAALQELDAELAQAEDRVAQTSEAAETARAEVSRIEEEAQRLRERRERDQSRLDSGSITVSRELQSLQHEIETLSAKVDEVEDTELEAMEEAEEADAQAQAAVAARDSVAARIEATTAERDAAIAELRSEAELVSKDRAETAATVSEDLAQRYVRDRERKGGVVVAALRQRRCSGCRMELNTADLAEIAARPAEDIVRCPECDRVLVRTEESGL